MPVTESSAGVARRCSFWFGVARNLFRKPVYVNWWVWNRFKAMTKRSLKRRLRWGVTNILSLRGCDFLLTVFVVPPSGGIEAATKPQVPVKTGTTNGAYRVAFWITGQGPMLLSKRLLRRTGCSMGSQPARGQQASELYQKSCGTFETQGILANPTTNEVSLDRNHGHKPPRSPRD